MAKPRLLVISASYLPAENIKKLAALGGHFDLTCVTADEAKSLGTTIRLDRAAAPENVRLIGLKSIGEPASTTRYFFRGLRGVIRSHPADIILVEAEPWAWVRWQAWWWKRIYQPRALFGEFTWENVERPGWRGAILRVVYRAAAMTSDFVIAGNRAAATLFERAGMDSSRQLIAPQLGVDEAHFTPPAGCTRDDLRAEDGLSANAFLVGFCGRFVEEKGVLDLVAAIDSVRVRQPLLAIELALIGAGPLQPELERLAAGRPWLRLLRRRAHTEIASFMQMLDLFVLPSRPRIAGDAIWEEQFGHVLIEAMACGVACLGSDSGEIPHVIGVPSAVFRAGDRGALAEKMEHLAGDRAAHRKLAETQRTRTLDRYTNRALAATWATFLEQQIHREKRSVLWVDAHLEYRSPTMRHLLYALPQLLEHGWEIKAWCLRSDAPRDQVGHTFFPAPKWLGPCDLIYFTLIVNLHGFVRWLCGRQKPATIIHATCGTYLPADLVSVHFLNSVWAPMQLRLGFSSAKEVARYGLVLIVAAIEWLQWRMPTLRKALAVSDSVGQEIRKRAPASLGIETLPNSYDETRFNPEVRRLHREGLRAELGYNPPDQVFCFVSAGHYRRKGFWLAVEALAILREDTDFRHVRFLVVGGNESTVAATRLATTRQFPGSDAWISFVGMQPEVEKYYAASDAFLFPSYFEAFCLAEIEAAACGLPLLLTPHHGTEMILEPGVNGLFLSFDPKEMSQQIASFLKKPALSFKPGPGRGLTRTQYTAQLLATYDAMLADTDLPLPKEALTPPKCGDFQRNSDQHADR